jgi:branched-chain amino acid transport system permease protein
VPVPFVKTPHLDVHFREAGAGPNVFVFVHGNFGSSRWWTQTLARLPAGFRAYAPDLRGCGDTTLASSSDHAFDIAPLAADLLDFVDALHLRSFHLVGHSLGGAVALRFALGHARRVRSLTLVAPAPATGLVAMREGSSTSARLLRLIDPEHGPSMSVLHSGYRIHHALGTNRLMLRGALAKMMPTATLSPNDVESLLDDAARMSPAAVIGFLQALHRWNVTGELRNLHVPTLVLAGGADVLVPAPALQEIAQNLPRGEILVWPEVGHSPQLERPDEFVGLLAASARRSPLMRLRTWWWKLLTRPSRTPGPASTPSRRETPDVLLPEARWSGRMD